HEAAGENGPELLRHAVLPQLLERRAAVGGGKDPARIKADELARVERADLRRVARQVARVCLSQQVADQRLARHGREGAEIREEARRDEYADVGRLPEPLGDGRALLLDLAYEPDRRGLPGRDQAEVGDGLLDAADRVVRRGVDRD